MKVRKAVIPAAGFGTRFLPVSRSVPKVLLPVLDTPSIHLVVQEAAQAGIEEIIIVISRGQEAIHRYFRRMPHLERALKRRGHLEVLRQMEAIASMASISYVVQEEPLGLGHAVLSAKDHVGGEPFAVLLPDDLIWSDRPVVGSLMEAFAQHGASVLAVREVAQERISSLGIIAPVPVEERLYRVRGLVEKPRMEEAPSNLAIVGRYVLTPQVLEELERVRPGALGEIQLTDAIAALVPKQGVYAYRFPGVHIDVGVPLGLLKASAYVAMQRKGLSDELRQWLCALLGGEELR